MFGSLKFHLRRCTRAIWFLPSIYAAIAVLALAVAGSVGEIVPARITAPFDLDVVDRVLGILASSMLAVAIFSLTTMVAAFQAASQAATPRVRTLLMEDRTAQRTISVFIGTFLFSLLGVIGLSTDFFDESGRFLIFILSLIVIAVVIATLIRWIEKLSHIGGVEEAIDRTEKATVAACTAVAADPLLGGRLLREAPPGASAVSAERIGYVQHVDAQALGAIADRLGRQIFLIARPGAYVDPTRPLVLVDGDLDEDARAELRRAFFVGGSRTFAEDPSFGLTVLSEIASRALSPGINDPGTAIDVIGTLTRILDRFGAALEAASPEVRHENLIVEPIDLDRLLLDAFRAIGRDCAALWEVQLRLQKSLATLAAARPGLYAEAARRLSREALERARSALTSAAEVEEVEAAARLVGRETVVDCDSVERGD